MRVRLLLWMGFVALMIALATAVMAHAETPVDVIQSRLRAAASDRREVGAENGTVGLVVFGGKELQYKKAYTISVAVSGFGDVVGIVSKPGGKLVCRFGGYTDGSCLVLSGCIAGTSC